MDIKWTDLQVGDKLEYNINFIVEAQRDASLHKFLKENMDDILVITYISAGENLITIECTNGGRGASWLIYKDSGALNEFPDASQFFNVVELTE